MQQELSDKVLRFLKSGDLELVRLGIVLALSHPEWLKKTIPWTSMGSDAFSVYDNNDFNRNGRANPIPSFTEVYVKNELAVILKCDFSYGIIFCRSARLVCVWKAKIDKIINLDNE